MCKKFGGVGNFRMLVNLNEAALYLVKITANTYGAAHVLGGGGWARYPF